MTSSRLRWMAPILGTIVLAGWGAGVARAQQPSTEGAGYEDIYAEDDQAGSEDRHAFGIGLGIVLPNENGNNDGEIYFSANYRWRVFDRDHRSGDDDRTSGTGYNQRHNSQHQRGHYPGQASEGGIRGFLEPEIGYWSRNKDNTDASDLLIGLNLIGVVPTRSADFTLGVGFGVHFIDGNVLNRDSAGQVFAKTDLSDTRVGANVQVGVELHVSQHLGIFGTGRLDILQDQPFDRQTKIWGGVRYHF